MTETFPPLQVLLTSTSYPRDAQDWRGIFIRHLVDALARRPDLQLEVWAPAGPLPQNASSVATTAEAAWLLELMDRGGISHLMRSGGPATLAAPLRMLRQLGSVFRRQADASVRHINWLQCALPLPDDGKPAVISVLGNDLKLLRLPLMKPLLRRAMRGRRVILCPNASWMRPALLDAFGTVARVEVVSFGIDPCWYEIERRPQAGPSAWLAVTRLTRQKLGPLFEWSAPLFADGARELHLFGPMQEHITLPPWVKYHGAATPEVLCRQWFPSAQGLITLSQHAEGRPQVMLEAMGSGLPIIASRIPAHADLLDDGRTGLLCGSPQEYASALKHLESPQTALHIGQAARRWVREEVGTWDDCAARYVRLYREVATA